MFKEVKPMYDYRYEPHRVIFMIDNKSFFASCEALRLGLNPMKAALAVVSQQPNSDWGSGLIMAASPLAKKKYGLKNVMRARDLPDLRKAPDLKIVEPHMNLYIKRSMQILNIFKKYAADEDIHVYSIDESMIDMTKSWHLFGDDPYYVGRRIQEDIRNTLIDYWHYIDVPDTIWKISKLEDVWGINTRTAEHLRRIGINNMYELAHTDPDILKKEFGVIGEQLFAMSWGVDRSIISHKYFPQNKSYGNSQVLTRAYLDQRQIEIVIREIGEQVAARIRAYGLKVGRIGLFVGYSFKERENGDRRGGFRIQQKITPTSNNDELVRELHALFRKKWHGEAVRTIGVDYSQLNPPEQEIKKRNFDMTVDKIRKKYGFASLVKASSLLEGATAIRRSILVGGHNGGNAYE